MGQIGQMLGVLDHTFSITNDAGDKVTLAVKLDCRTASDQDIRSWVTSNRIIAGQRPWRGLSADELKALNGQTFMVQDIGRKIKSREERVQAYVNAGIPAKLAGALIDDPDKAAEFMSEFE